MHSCLEIAYQVRGLLKSKIAFGGSNTISNLGIDINSIFDVISKLETISTNAEMMFMDVSTAN